jgi:hypothetical protein
VSARSELSRVRDTVRAGQIPDLDHIKVRFESHSQTRGPHSLINGLSPCLLVVHKATAELCGRVEVNGPWPDPSWTFPGPRPPFHLHLKPLGLGSALQ